MSYLLDPGSRMHSAGMTTNIKMKKTNKILLITGVVIIIGCLGYIFGVVFSWDEPHLYNSNALYVSQSCVNFHKIGINVEKFNFQIPFKSKCTSYGGLQAN